MSTKMVQGTLVIDHIIHMIGVFNKIEILIAEIDGETQIDMILETLPDFFKQFKLNYNKLMMSLEKLLKEHQMVKGILKEHMGCSYGSQGFFKFFYQEEEEQHQIRKGSREGIR